jgi:hypothetical protein
MCYVQVNMLRSMYVCTYVLAVCVRHGPIIFHSEDMLCASMYCTVLHAISLY